MRALKSRIAVAAVALLILSIPAMPAEAQAPSAAHPAASGTNPLLNGDLLFQISVEDSQGNNGPISNAVEGHLVLKKYKGTTYHGTFVDNTAGGKTYKATATGVSTTQEAGHVTVATHEGTFTINQATDSAPPPAKFGKHAIAFIDYEAHSSTAASPMLVTLGAFSTFGAYHPAVSGTLQLTYDALGFIEPHSSKSHIAGSFVYKVGSGTKKHTSYVTSSGSFRPADCENEGNLTFALPVGSTTWHVAATENDGKQTGCPLFATAVTGSGSTYAQADFVAAQNFK
jgi:hypothetical protein